MYQWPMIERGGLAFYTNILNRVCCVHVAGGVKCPSVDRRSVVDRRRGRRLPLCPSAPLPLCSLPLSRAAVIVSKARDTVITDVLHCAPPQLLFHDFDSIDSSINHRRSQGQ